MPLKVGEGTTLLDPCSRPHLRPLPATYPACRDRSLLVACGGGEESRADAEWDLLYPSFQGDQTLEALSNT